ncbi:MAG: ABC transporter substrate-binding protein [Proteobacteria bacterium]|nr:ABC transporter substrate-binding protein [Pseudomonadota bacterium]
MSKQVPITIACGDYDRTRAIKDGRVGVDGCEVTYLPLEPEELFFRAFRYTDFDVAELSFNSYLMTTTRDRCPYVALPAFVSRHFRHSCLFIRTDRGIRSPQDLKGKLVGLPEYQQTANVWMRGILKEEYGVDPADIRWRTGGQEEPGRDERTPLTLPPGVELEAIPNDKTLNKMLADGELDAVFSARELSCYVKGAPNVGLMFPNFREVESDYYRRTKIFPMMHVIGVRKTLVERYPWLPATVYKAFCQAKEVALREMAEQAVARLTLPWPEVNLQDAKELMGNDFWRYGVNESAHEIETLVRYSVDQGLAARKLELSEIFHPSVYEISRT